MAATLTLVDGVLQAGGALERAAVPALWAALPLPATGACTRIDLSRVTAIDTAGLALLAEIATRARRADGTGPTIHGAPAGYDALCAAYRIRPDLHELPDAPFA